MSKDATIDVSTVNELEIYGKDLLRIRYKNELSRQVVCDTMCSAGFIYYPVKLFRLERCVKFRLDSAEMLCLIKAVKATFSIK